MAIFMNNLCLGIKDFNLDEEICIRGYFADGSEIEYQVNTQFNMLTNNTKNLTNLIEHIIFKSDSKESLQHSICGKTGRNLISYRFNIYDVILLTSEVRELKNINKLLNNWFCVRKVVKIEIFWVNIRQSSIKELNSNEWNHVGIDGNC